EARQAVAGIPAVPAAGGLLGQVAARVVAVGIAHAAGGQGGDLVAAGGQGHRARVPAGGLVRQRREVAQHVVAVCLGVGLGGGRVGAARGGRPHVRGGGGLFPAGGLEQPVERAVAHRGVQRVRGRAGQAAAGCAVCRGERVADQVVPVAGVLQDCAG